MLSSIDRHAVAPVPAGTALLHIGPHKTGTTALQHACHQARAELASQGVLYASRARHNADAARFAIGSRPRRGEAVGRELWAHVSAALNDHRFARRIFSSESFANADDAGAARVIADLAPAERVHVVVSARPLAHLLPSQYQQFVQRGVTVQPFGPWVEGVLGRRDDVKTRLFWHRHRLDEQVRRWGDLVGYDNLTVLVVDGADRRFLPESFERLLGVARGTLADREVRSNRSLTAAEVELIRQWHVLGAAAGMPRAERHRMTGPVCDHLKRRDRDPGEPRLTLPAWAVEEANQRGAAIASRIAETGVRVLGDLGALSAVPTPEDGPAPEVAMLDVEVAAQFALGLTLAR
ncbi:hypothetical protein [Nocardioides sp.]|uniref:hypothetical protein n=1 Tax=Nocardioides sp. TaxID=35761 RepID=UPI002B6A06BB|nr:hypothetical protein [Nocardioides sp.]HVX55533.1 hypothetical protein [Nocardioides sp.]